MDLYYSPASSGCRAIQMTAKALGLTLNLKLIDTFKKEQMTPEFLKLNPQHTIPTLVDGNFSIWESRAIVIYLVEKYAKNDSLYPKDPQTRAVINQRLYFDLGTLYGKFSNYAHTKIMKNFDDPEKFKEMVSSVELLEKFLEGQDFLAGNQLTIADIAIIATISSIELMGVDLSKYSNISRWFQKCKGIIPGYDINEEGLQYMLAMMKKVQATKTV